MKSDEQIEFWLNQKKEIVNDHSRSKRQKEFEPDDL